MFKQSGEGEYEANSESGVRHLFRLAHYAFQDTLDGEGVFHHHVIETADDDTVAYEAGRELMYEFMARYLAGVYEKEEYDLDRSPGHEALLDVLELATARARAGETDFSVDELDRAEVEVLDEDADEAGDEEAGGEEGGDESEGPPRDG
ncbi:MAG TPA: hypothetical protein VFH27_17185, partial [Longimicrobiaceae bacterium]|nr:hypothetical protein [Longimicrobiaceae bacterium]